MLILQAGMVVRWQSCDHSRGWGDNTSGPGEGLLVQSYGRPSGRRWRSRGQTWPRRSVFVERLVT